MDSFPQTDRTTASRDRGRMSYQRAAANAILDEAYLCHVSFVHEGTPRVLPTLHVRIGDTLYLHGSTGSRPLLAARTGEGLDLCVAVTHLDGLVFARSQFHHSANYRSVIVHGRARLVAGEAAKLRAMTALVDKVAPGRSADSRPPNRRELAETAVLAIPLTEASVKARASGVADEPEDLDLPYWAGVVPLRLVPGLPAPDEGVRVSVPSYLRGGMGPWLTAPVLRGDHVILEPLDPSHVEGLFAAIADDEVYRWIPRPRPGTPIDMADQVAEALHQHALGERVPFVQRSAMTGEVIGTTSFYAIDEPNRSLAIGSTMLGPAWWRTGVNTEAKLLLLQHAFDTLGAVRVEWHTDLRNLRSQRAIERLGATREGVLRKHKRLPDGSWRDSVLYAMTDAEWPTAHSALRKRLRPAVPVG
jgi:uncharacterized protein